MKIVLYHNPNCSKSRGALELLQEKALTFETVLYLDSPPSREVLSEMIETSGADPKDFVRTSDSKFRAANLSLPDEATTSDVLDLLGTYPEVMQRPIVVVDGRAIISRPSEKFLELL